MGSTVFLRSEELLLKKLKNNMAELISKLKQFQGIQASERVYEAEVGKFYAQDDISDRNKIKSSIDKMRSSFNELSDVSIELLDKVKKLEQLLELLIRNEQTSLAMHSRAGQDILSEMVDAELSPMQKYTEEADNLTSIRENLDILRIEIEKQKEYLSRLISAGDSPLEDLDMIRQSDDGQISNEQMILQIIEMSESVRKHIDIKSDKPEIVTETDVAATALLRELKKTKIAFSGFFSMNIYEIVERLVEKNIRSFGYDKIICFMIFYLMSRMKQYRKGVYDKQLRVCLLTHALSYVHGQNKEQKMISTGAALIYYIESLNFNEEDIGGKLSIEQTELRLIKKYYASVDKIMRSEICFLYEIVDGAHNRELLSGHGGWIADSKRFICLANDLDDYLVKNGASQDIIASFFKAEGSKYHIAGLDEAASFIDKHYKKIIPSNLQISQASDSPRI